MCGIWGFVGEDDTIPGSVAWGGLQSLTDRGPDDWGIYLSPGGKVTDAESVPDRDLEVFLGNRRLSILDLSAAGNQPMTAEDGTLALVYNGEVYNYESIRKDLRELGYEFESDSDTEVVLNAYREYGPDCVDRFRGMFAFVVWNETTGKLFAARDRLGIKPFYYAVTDAGFCFASQVRSLLGRGPVNSQLDPEAVDDYLAIGFVPEPGTIIAGVDSLPAGSTLEYDRTTGEVEVNRYWSIDFDDGSDPSPSEVYDRLADSVSQRMVSDVPVGAFLSGGLDSSSVVALMREVGEADSDLRTFSIDFEEPEYSEGANASAVAEEIGTDHTSQTVGPDDIERSLDDIVGAMDQPTIDGINTYFVSRLAARDGLRVALSGLGSDELFYGYSTFGQTTTLYTVARATDRLPRKIQNILAWGTDRAARLIEGWNLDELTDVLRSGWSFGASYVAVRGVFPHRYREALTDRSTGNDLPERVEASVSETLETVGPAAAVSHAELRWYMRDQLLRKADAMSMAHSLELRVPFLGTELVEYVQRSDAEYMDDQRPKKLLKRAVVGAVPDTVIEREKQPFAFPLGEWLEDELQHVVDESLSEESLTGTPLDPDAVDEVRQAYRDGRLHWNRVWALIVLVRWIDEHVAVEGGIDSGTEEQSGRLNPQPGETRQNAR